MGLRLSAYRSSTVLERDHFYRRSTRSPLHRQTTPQVVKMRQAPCRTLKGGPACKGGGFDDKGNRADSPISIGVGGSERRLTKSICSVACIVLGWVIVVCASFVLCDALRFGGIDVSVNCPLGGPGGSVSLSHVKDSHSPVVFCTVQHPRVSVGAGL